VLHPVMRALVRLLAGHPERVRRAGQPGDGTERNVLPRLRVAKRSAEAPSCEAFCRGSELRSVLRRLRVAESFGCPSKITAARPRPPTSSARVATIGCDPTRATSHSSAGAGRQARSSGRSRVVGAAEPWTVACGQRSGAADGRVWSAQRRRGRSRVVGAAEPWTVACGWRSGGVDGRVWSAQWSCGLPGDQADRERLHPGAGHAVHRRGQALCGDAAQVLQIVVDGGQRRT
jgi:hypothetical protein